MAELKVLTLNVWGLWLVSKKREERIGHLAAYLRGSTEDVVLLQEVWVDADAQRLIRAGRAAGLQHSTHFRSGRFGSGLVTLSRHPIVRHAFWRYAAAGFATSITCGDFYAGKGVGWVRLATSLGDVDVFNTHLHANYCHDYRMPAATLCKSAAAATAAITGDAATQPEPSDASGSRQQLLQAPAWLGSRVPDDDDAGTRVCQMLELTELVDIISNPASNPASTGSGGGSGSAGGTTGGSRLVVLGGDLNCEPDTLEMDLLRMRLPALRDAWECAEQRSTSSTGSATHQGNDDNEFSPGGSGNSGQAGGGGESANPHGFTCHAPGNSYQPRRQVPERIDYVWSNLACRRAEIALQMTPGGTSYSDHFAVRAVLVAAEPTASASAGGKLGAMKLGAMFKKAPAAGGSEPALAGSSGEGLTTGRKVATALAAAMLLEEGIRGFSTDSAVMTALAGFTLASVVYTALALPVFIPEMAFRGWLFSLVLLVAGGAAAAGTALLVMGALADRSQKRALQSAYRQLRVWMQQHLGLEGTGGGDEAAVLGGLTAQQ